jgi:tetratricopeptide (TPR) repeat protein
MRRLVENDESIALSRLLAFHESEFLSDPAVHYAHVRSLFRFLAANDKLNALYDLYISNYDSDPSGALALRRTFDQSLHAIERDWHEWVANERDTDETPRDDRRIIAVNQRAPQPPSAIDAPSSERRASNSRPRAGTRFAQFMDRHAKGDYASMIQPLREIIEMQPTLADARYKLGLAYVATSSFDGARRQYAALRDLDPSLASLLSNLIDQSAAPR